MPNEDSWDAVTTSPYANPYDTPRPFAGQNAPDPMDLAAMKAYQSMQSGGDQQAGAPSGSYQYPGQPKINIPMDAQGRVQPGFHVPSMESQGRNDPNARPPAPPAPPAPQGSPYGSLDKNAFTSQSSAPQAAAMTGLRGGAPAPQGQAPQGQPAPQAPPEKPNAFAFPPNPPKLVGPDEVMAQVKKLYPTAQPWQIAQITQKTYEKLVKPKNDAMTHAYAIQSKGWEQNRKFLGDTAKGEVAGMKAYIAGMEKNYNIAHKNVGDYDKELKRLQAIVDGGEPAKSWGGKQDPVKLKDFTDAVEGMKKYKDLQKQNLEMVGQLTDQLKAAAPALIKAKAILGATADEEKPQDAKADEEQDAPHPDAKQADDGNWYVEKDGKFFRVDK